MSLPPTSVLRLAGSQLERFATAPFCVLPIGSIEFHGPGAAFGTDSTLATGFAERLATVRDCLLFPAVHYSFVPRLTADRPPAPDIAAPAASILVCNWWRLAPAGLFGDSDGHGHGGPLEVSTTAVFDAGGVDLQQDAAADIAYEAPWWRGAAQVVGRGQAPIGFKGYHGRVSQVDIAKGETIVASVTSELARLVDDWLVRAGADLLTP